MTAAFALRPLWLHEIKHDGFRLIARKDGDATLTAKAAIKRQAEEDGIK
jgi:ATP-dependent DNA ligase